MALTGAHDRRPAISQKRRVHHGVFSVKFESHRLRLPPSRTSMNSKSRVSIQDVARAAGVSAQTVSRVVNQSPTVSEETRTKILALIDTMGYRANLLGRSLLRGKTQTLGVVCSGIGHTGGMRILQGITRGANQAGYALHLKGIDHHSHDEVANVLEHLLQWQVEGILWAIPEVGHNRDWLKKSRKLPVPMIMLSMAAREGWDSIAFDNHQGGLLATRHLIAQGRRRIAHIAGPQDWWEATERKRGWLDALQEAGLKDAGWIDAAWCPERASSALGELLRQQPDIDAVFAANDHMALGALKEAARLGLRVPEDLAVIGFDNLAESAFYQPALSTIEQDQSAIGEWAVNSLIARIETRQIDPLAQALSLTPRLVLRASA